MRLLSSVLQGLRARDHLIGAITVVCLLLVTSQAQGPKPAPKVQTKPEATPEKAQAPTATVHEMTAADVEAFLDGLMPQQLAREDLAGAVISIVKDGKVLFAKGYGFSDVAKRTPVSPENTLFRPGSISKLFTWTAVMQQVEQGKLNLDHDVNEYLDFKIPETYPQPITLRNIMTHTSGFEETVQELFVGDAAHLKPLRDYLVQHMPARIFPPGTTPAYSNYATTMAGYIVQRVSGQPFDDYVEQHIINPLGMTHTTFRQPLPAALAPLMSKGYEVASQPAKDFEFVEAAPAGSASVSAMDMTRFMRAHLQDGQFEGAQILRPETAKLMHSRAFENLPAVNGMALGFYEETRNGHRIFGHGGDTEYFHSDLHLMPDAQLGFFVSYNSAGKGEIRGREAVWHAFLDRYFPYQPPAATVPGDAAKDGDEVSGHYIVSRRADESILKMLTVIGETKISRNEDNTISSPDLKGMNGEPLKFQEISPLLFREVNGQDLLGFKRDASGNLVGVIDFPFMVFQKAHWYNNSAFHLPLLITSLVLLVLTVLLWPVMGLLRRHYAKPLTVGAKQKKLRIWVRLTCVLYILFFAGYGIFFTMALKDIGMFGPAGNPWIRLIQLVGWLAVLGSIVAIYNAVLSWQEAERWRWARIGDTLIALACVGTIWFIFTWNMLELSLRY